MRKLILSAAIVISITAKAQSNTASTIIEGGKTLVELVRVFKAPKYMMTAPVAAEKKDSCSIKAIGDLCLKNSTEKPLLVSLYKRNGNGYDAGILTMNILPKNQECLYELKSGIYKLKIETEDNGVRKTFREGEIKLNNCDNQIKEIKN